MGRLYPLPKCKPLLHSQHLAEWKGGMPELKLSTALREADKNEVGGGTG